MVGPGELRKGVSGVVKPTMPTCTQGVMTSARCAAVVPATDELSSAHAAARGVIVFEHASRRWHRRPTLMPEGVVMMV